MKDAFAKESGLFRRRQNSKLNGQRKRISDAPALYASLFLKSKYCHSGQLNRPARAINPEKLPAMTARYGKSDDHFVRSLDDVFRRYSGIGNRSPKAVVVAFDTLDPGSTMP
jgi:hypothetical protein